MDNNKIPDKCDKVLFAEDLVAYMLCRDTGTFGVMHETFEPSVATPYREFIYQAFNIEIKVAVIEIHRRVNYYRQVNPPLPLSFTSRKGLATFAKRLQKQYFEEGFDPKLFLFYCVHILISASRLARHIGVQAAGDLAVAYILEGLGELDMLRGGWDVLTLTAKKYEEALSDTDYETLDFEFATTEDELTGSGFEEDPDRENHLRNIAASRDVEELKDFDVSERIKSFRDTRGHGYSNAAQQPRIFNNNHNNGYLNVDQQLGIFDSIHNISYLNVDQQPRRFNDNIDLNLDQRQNNIPNYLNVGQSLEFFNNSHDVGNVNICDRAKKCIDDQENAKERRDFKKFILLNETEKSKHHKGLKNCLTVKPSQDSRSTQFVFPDSRWNSFCQMSSASNEMWDIMSAIEIQDITSVLLNSYTFFSSTDEFDIVAELKSSVEYYKNSMSVKENNSQKHDCIGLEGTTFNENNLTLKKVPNENIVPVTSDMCSASLTTNNVPCYTNNTTVKLRSASKEGIYFLKYSLKRDCEELESCTLTEDGAIEKEKMKDTILSESVTASNLCASSSNTLSNTYTSSINFNTELGKQKVVKENSLVQCGTGSFQPHGIASTFSSKSVHSQSSLLSRTFDSELSKVCPSSPEIVTHMPLKKRKMFFSKIYHNTEKNE